MPFSQPELAKESTSPIFIGRHDRSISTWFYHRSMLYPRNIYYFASKLQMSGVKSNSTWRESSIYRRETQSFEKLQSIAPFNAPYRHIPIIAANGNIFSLQGSERGRTSRNDQRPEGLQQMAVTCFSGGVINAIRCHVKSFVFKRMM